MLLSPNHVLQNRYLIVNLIAQGGMGAVYQAIDQRLGSTVALKQTLVHHKELRESFEREARMLAQLQHPVLPVVSDHFAEEEDEFLVMQYIPGDDLGILIEQEAKPFSPDEVLRWADQLLDALDYLHSQNPPVIHRDIKPRNLKLTPRQDIILLDFGLARGAKLNYKDNSSTHGKARILTPEYAPLEQIQGSESDLRSDLYALSATLYHLVTGKSPPDALTRAAAVLQEQPDPLRPANELNPLVPPAFALILYQAMSHSLEQRFASAAAMRTALRMVHRTGTSVVATDIPDDEEGQTTVPVIKNHQSATSTTEQKMYKQGPTLTLIVSKDDQGYYQTISEAIAEATPGARILVRPGLYRENVVIDKSLEITGDGPRDDIFIESTESTCIMMQTDYALLRGLTLRGRSGLSRKEFPAIDIPEGRLIIESCDISSDSQACIAIHGPKANPIIWQCQIHDGKGAGIVVYDRSLGIIEDCDIFSNGGAGIEIKQIGNPIIRQCKIHHGERDGIAVTEKGAGVISGCDIFSNARAGVSIERHSNPFVRLCKIHDQVNGYGIYVYDKGEGTVEGCNIFSNAKAGIGITHKGNPLIRRCKIHHEKQRGIFIFENGEGTIEKCSIIANPETGVSIGQGSTPTIRQCHINQNGLQGIRVLPHGGGIIEDCDLTSNVQGAWDVATKNYLRRSGNAE